MPSSRQTLLLATILILFALPGCDRCRAQSLPGGSEPSPSPSAAANDGDRVAPVDDAPTRLQSDDTGIFSEYDSQIRLAFPERFRTDRVVAVEGPASDDRFAYVAGHSVGLAPESWEPAIEVDSWRGADIDGDGIPNQLDILLGAKKTARNGADYEEGYEGMDYPGGDVPRSYGVCTDVVVRTLRNAGIDLQKRLHEDITAHRHAYPMVDTPDPNIDQRRVRTLLPYFERHWTARPTDPTDPSSLWLPGDIVFMNTMGDERPDHIGVVSDREGKSGYPLVINNWTHGHQTTAMDLLDGVPVTHRFRLDDDRPALSAAHLGLEGVLARHGLELPDDTDQVVAVTTHGWNRNRGQLQRFVRRDDTWTPVGDPIDVRLGDAGLGWGRGLHETPETPRSSLPDKREGDLRSPAGLFRLATAFGPDSARPNDTDWPWRTAASGDRFVDDPDSTHYNRWVGPNEVETPDWDSAEDLTDYRLGLLVEHNRSPTEPGAGSAIFLHTTRGTDTPTLGCTSMEEEKLRTLIAWLDPDGSPVLVQLPAQMYDKAEN